MKRTPNGRGKAATQFKPGNPGGPGRPKMPEELREAFRALAPEAIETLHQVMKTGERDGDRVRAAEVILERGWGKAPAAPEDREAMKEAARPLSVVSSADLAAVLAKPD